MLHGATTLLISQIMIWPRRPAHWCSHSENLANFKLPRNLRGLFNAQPCASGSGRASKRRTTVLDEPLPEEKEYLHSDDAEERLGGAHGLRHEAGTARSRRARHFGQIPERNAGSARTVPTQANPAR